jgi:hypothetical protein
MLRGKIAESACDIQTQWQGRRLGLWHAVMFHRLGFTLCAAVTIAVLACSSSTGPTGGFVAGPNNEHCVAAVYLDAGNDVQPDLGQYIDDAGNLVQEVGICDLPANAPPAPDYGDTNFGSQAADDDCKYNVSATVNPVQENQAVTFVVTATSRVDGGPVTGATARAEVYLCDGPSTTNAPCDSTHPAPPSGQTTTEYPDGTYTIGPIIFDAPGNADAGYWTVRFHFFESCADDVPQAKHGHAAFYLEVP